MVWTNTHIVPLATFYPSFTLVLAGRRWMIHIHVLVLKPYPNAFTTFCWHFRLNEWMNKLCLLFPYAWPFAQKPFFDNCRSVTLTRVCNCRSLTFDRAQLLVTHLSSNVLILIVWPNSYCMSRFLIQLIYCSCLRAVICNEEGLSISAAESSRILPKWCSNLEVYHAATLRFYFNSVYDLCDFGCW